MEYTLAASDETLYRLIDKWNELERIAVDFEGEFNLHIYGEHLCLIQIFDGKEYYIIDPRSRRISAESLCAFFTSPVRKVWFDMQSDNSLIHKIYGSSLSNVTDLRLMAIELGYNGNLTSLEETFLGTISEYTSKKKLQQTNWLKRPLTPEQIEYALSDVEYLLKLEDVLKPLVISRGLWENYEMEQMEASKPAKERPGWTRICNWKLLSREQKRAVREYFIARDVVARRFNVPAFHVLDKHRIADAGKRCPKSEEELFSILGPFPPKFSTALEQSMKVAFGRLHGKE